MKKIYLFLLVVLMASMSLSAQKVGYLLTESAITSLPDEDGQKPEQNAANWFKDTYVDQNVGQFVSLSDLASGLSSDIKVLWINVDRNINIETFDALFSQEVRTAITNYVKAGGNLYLSTHATRIIGPDYINRASYPSFTENNAFANGSDHWKVIASNGARGGDKSHSIYTLLISNGKEVDGESNRFYMQYGGGGDKPRSDRNCIWNVNGNEGEINSFQNNNSCRILGSFGHNDYVSVVGIAEFYPKNDFKGTVITNGLAACSFAEANANKDCVQYLTQGILDYLSKRATATWTTAPKANPVIKDEEDVNVTPGTNCTVTVTTSDPAIANYNVGHIYYNFFGNVTFTATATGDGVNIPKNAVLYPEVRTVTGGAPAAFGYILPSSIHIISANGYNGEGNYLPDYLAALWFYNEYVSQGKGCFINPAEASIPSQVKVLWINSDKNGLSTENFDAAYAGTGFVTALTNYVNTGGNLFLSKQAVRMLRKIGRYDNGTYPTYANGGYTDNNDDWKIRNSFFAGDGAVDYSSHLIFKDIEDSPFALIAGGGSHNHRTDNNNLIYDEVFNDKDAMQSFETNHNCRILGTWPNAAVNKCDRGVLVEFLPQSATAGTIIEVGASAYQWNDKGTINLENIHPNMKKLTSNILSYLYSLTTYTRNVPADHYGTICLPRASASLSDGMTVYRVLSDQTDGIMLEEVNAMEAGVPYFFYSTVDQITVTMTGAAVAAPQDGNGLVGNFGPENMIVPNETDNFILGSDNTLYFVDAGSIVVGANRAYLDRSAIAEAAPMAGAPRRKVAIHTAPDSATAIEMVETTDGKPVKMIINGHFYVRRDGRLYDSAGARVK